MLSCGWKAQMAIDVKTIGSSGQISLGKEYAGRTVAVEEIEQGVWLIKSARVIPENELWLHTPSASRKISRATEWAEQNPPKESNLDTIERKLRRRR
jgi:hypothetical protein